MNMLEKDLQYLKHLFLKQEKQWESLKKAKLELELSEKEAKGFRQVQTTDPTDVMGMEPQSEEKHLASGLFK